MLSCRDVTERASLIVDGELPAGERFGVRVHLLICSHCRRFLKQLRGLTVAIRQRGEQHNDTPVDPALQERILAALAAPPSTATNPAPPPTGNRDEPP